MAYKQLKVNQITTCFVFVLLLHTWVFHAQKEANIWYFGYNAGLDFNSGSPVVIKDGQLVTEEGCATISNKDGQLLFYTDGSTVWNRNHNVMMNGTGLKGHYSSTNAAIIVPKPDFPDVYYIFTVDAEAGVNGLQFSEVDMSLDEGMGGVTSSKNNFLFAQITEQVTAIKNPSSNSYWVVSHKWTNNEFIAYEVTSSGVNTNPVISALGGTTMGNFFGVMKISPNGRKIAISNIADGRLALCDFNPVTGQVSNYMNLQIHAYGIEFSPNSKLLYVCDIAEGKTLTQFNLESNNEAEIYNSRVIVSHAKDNQNFGALQLGPDGKIYIAKWALGHLDVINNPNRLGLNCNYQAEAVHLDGRISKLGLPPFIQSFFNRTISFENICFGSTTQFELSDVDSAVWDFGDPNSGTYNASTDIEPTHIFSAPGTYQVSVTATIDIETVTATTTITILEEESVASIPDYLNGIEVIDSSDNNSITVRVENLQSGNYEFALDGFSYQNEPYFSPIAPGMHTLYIKNKENCIISYIMVPVVGYPKYFTPNGDGVNDYWQIKDFYDMFQFHSDIFIYDRYGKLLKQMGTSTMGWDGSFNGSMLPSDDYWFRVKLLDGKEFKGHFTLKR